MRRHLVRLTGASAKMGSLSRPVAAVATGLSTTPSGDTQTRRIGTLQDLGLLPDKSSNVLIVGDGNFSFTSAFLRHNQSIIENSTVNVIATSLDTREEVLQMYPRSQEILDQVSAAGAQIVHDVNGTRLEEYEFCHNQTFDRIVFNFPHYAEGGSKRNKIHRHRQLLLDFFSSANKVLNRDGQVWVTLCAGQGGTPADTKTRSWGDNWQVQHCAASAGLILLDAHVCPMPALHELGYYNVGYQLREQAFFTSDSVSHVFVREDIGAVAQFPMEWTRDISFWVEDGFTEEALLDVLHQFFVAPIELRLNKINDYVCPKTHRLALTYTMQIQSDRVALTKERVNELAVNALHAVEASSFASSRAS